MNKELRILVVEDSPEDMALINYELRKAGLRFRSRRVESRDAFLHELEHHSPDIILSDHGVPGFDGFAALAEARSRCPEAPFIFVTGAPRDEAARQTLHSGADDYVLKSHLNLLGPAVERAIREAATRANRSQLEMALHNAEEQLRLLTDELKEHATFMLDAEGRVASWNPGAEEMLGYEPNEILDRPIGEIFADETRHSERQRQLLETASHEGRAGDDISFSRKSGETIRLDTTIIIQRGVSRNLRGFFCVLHDSARRKQSPQPPTVEAMKAADTAAEMEKFTHAVALDLQPPLREIETCSEWLIKSAGEQLDQKNRDYLTSIREASNRMSRLVDDLFTFSRIGQAQMHHLPFSLRELVKEVIHDSRTENEGRQVEWVIGDLPDVAGDSVMLWQVMKNLISNALKFTRKKEKARIEIGAKDTHAEHVIFVRDNGIGFEPQAADRLFGVFQRLHTSEFEGTGVGLANVRRIIERHGGRVWAESAPDQGATFYFTLPKPA